MPPVPWPLALPEVDCDLWRPTSCPWCCPLGPCPVLQDLLERSAPLKLPKSDGKFHVGAPSAPRSSRDASGAEHPQEPPKFHQEVIFPRGSKYHVSQMGFPGAPRAPKVHQETPTAPEEHLPGAAQAPQQEVMFPGGGKSHCT